jgi:MFS family permease
MPQVIGLVQQLFRGPERGRAFGLFGAMIGISTALGPTIGGGLIAIGGEESGWRLLFWMNVPLGIAALLFALKLLPKGAQGRAADRELDIVGILLLGGAIVTLMLPFVLTTGGGGSGAGVSGARWLWLVAFAVFVVAFVWWERRYTANGKSPVVHFELFRLSSYRNGLSIVAVYFAALPASFLMVTLYLQEGLGLAPLFAGMVSIPFAATSAAGSAAGSWCRRTRPSPSPRCRSSSPAWRGRCSSSGSASGRRSGRPWRRASSPGSCAGRRRGRGPARDRVRVWMRTTTPSGAARPSRSR